MQLPFVCAILSFVLASVRARSMWLRTVLCLIRVAMQLRMVLPFLPRRKLRRV